MPSGYILSDIGTSVAQSYDPISMSEDDGSSSGRSWSPIIGIVTAIIGNILISLALNTQRYAHIRLGREKREAEEKDKKARNRGRKSYGTVQSEIAERRAEENQKGQDNGKQSADHARGVDGTQESQPLLSESEQRDQDDEDPNKKSSAEKSYLQSPYWWMGISLMTVGECGNFLAYGFAPASIVSPLGVVALVSNCLIAPLMLHEPFRARDGLGVLIAVAGCVTVVLSASGSNPKLDQDEIWDLISRWEFETYFGITLFLIIVLMAASNRYGDKSVLVDLGLVGLFGGYTALSTKGVASLLSNKIWHVITFPITYLLVFVLVTTAVMQIKYVNRALYRFDSTQVIPVQFVLFTLSVIIGSAVLYRDFERKTAEDAGKFFGGCALTFLGVWCITSGRGHGGDSDEESGSEDEDQIQLVDEEGHLPEIREEGGEEDLLRPYTPRLQSSYSDAPIFKFTQHDGSFPEPSPMLGNPYDRTQNAALAAAIHNDPAEIPATPSPKRSNKYKPPMHATTSEPVLPTSAYLREYSTAPNTPLVHRPSQDHLRTPETPGLDPATGSVPRFGSVTRSSIATLLPNVGPLTNPLSNSLSVIVADSLRRGVDVDPSGTFRRTRLRSKRSKKFDMHRHHSMAEGADLARTQSQGLQPSPNFGAENARPGRGRSLSATIGDMLRITRPRRGTLGESDNAV